VASLGPDAIVYENGGVLYEYNLASGKASNIPIQVHAEDIEARPEFKALPKISAVTEFLLPQHASL